VTKLQPWPGPLAAARRVGHSGLQRQRELCGAASGGLARPANDVGVQEPGEAGW